MQKIVMSKEYEKNSGFQKQSSLNILEKISTILKEVTQQNPERLIVLANLSQ